MTIQVLFFVVQTMFFKLEALRVDMPTLRYFKLKLRKRPTQCFPQVSFLEAALLVNEQLGIVDAEHLVRGMRAPDCDIDAAMACLKLPYDQIMLNVNEVLSPSICRCLRDYALRTLSTVPKSIDAMDGIPERRVEVPKEILIDLIGPDTFSYIWSLPNLLPSSGFGCRWVGNAAIRRFGFESGDRHSLGFHVDSTEVTINIALNPSEDHDGGSLFVAAGGGVRLIHRDEGTATIHAGDVAHGVSEVTRGERYSLLIFFQREGYLFQTTNGRRRSPAQLPYN